VSRPIPQLIIPILNRHGGDKQPELSITRMKAMPKKLGPKPTTDPKRATLKTKNQAVTNIKTVFDKPNPTTLVVPTPSTNFPLVGISDLLDNLPLASRVELTRWLHTSISSVSTEVAARGYS
jgi:hypothetical protein